MGDGVCNFIRRNSDRCCLCTARRSCGTSNARRARAFAVRCRGRRPRVGAERPCQFGRAAMVDAACCARTRSLSGDLDRGAGAARCGDAERTRARGGARTVLARDTLGRCCACRIRRNSCGGAGGGARRPGYDCIRSALVREARSGGRPACGGRVEPVSPDGRGDRRIDKAAPHAGPFDRGRNRDRCGHSGTGGRVALHTAPSRARHRIRETSARPHPHRGRHGGCDLRTGAGRNGAGEHRHHARRLWRSRRQGGAFDAGQQIG